MVHADLIRTLAYLIIGVILPPLVAVLLAVKKKWVNDIDISNRPQRVRVLAVLGVLLVLDAVYIRMLGVPVLDQLFRLFAMWFVGFFLITLAGWKISGHIGIYTFCVLILTSWLGAHLSVLFFFVPLIAWARLTLKKHTISQLIGGFVYTIALYTIVQAI